MKKFYTTRAASNLNYSRFSDQRPFVKGLSLAVMVVFLSNIFSVRAGVTGNSVDVEPTSVQETALDNTPTTSRIGVTASHVSEAEPSLSFSMPATEQVSALESDPAALRVDVSADTESLEANNVKRRTRLRSFSLPEALLVSALEGNSTAINVDDVSEDTKALGAGALNRSFSMPEINQPMARGFKPFSARAPYIARGGLPLGEGAKARASGSIAIGQDTYHNNSSSDYWVGPVAEGEMSIAIGISATSLTTGAMAIGGGAEVKEKDAEMAVAIGYDTVVSVAKGIALGANTNAITASGIVGYNPKTGVASTLDDVTWKSTYGVMSIGVFSDNKPVETRQLVGLAAGTEDTDAVNVAQLKELREMVVGGWKFTIDGENATDVSLNSENAIDFSAGSSNLKIATGDNKLSRAAEGNKVIFDLSEDLTLHSVKLGASILDATGLIVADGPKITKDGISAGSHKITEVAQGTADTDAVNFEQLKTTETKIEQQVASNSFVKQDDNAKHITIGKDTDGDKIDIANNEGQKRTLTGIKDGALLEDSNEAVTGSQLYSLGNEVAKFLGGNAKYENGKWTAPKFTVKTVNEDGTKVEEQSYSSVAEAFTGVGSSFTNVNKKITDVKNSVTNIKNEVTEQVKDVITKVEGDSLVKQDADTQHITIGKGTGGDKIDVANNDTEKRTLTGLKEGNLSADSSEAVTGSQLFATNNNVTSLDDNISKYLGGEANVLKGKAPTYKIGNTSYSDVGSAFAGIDSSFTEVKNEITKVENSVTNIKTEVTEQVNNVVTTVEGDSLVKWEEDGQLIKIGAEKHGNIITIADKEGKDRKLSNVQAGDLSKDSTDAVNGSQLFVTNKNVTSLDSSISEYLGGGANVLEGKQPTYTVQSQTYHNVANAFEGIDSSFTEVDKKITDVTNSVTNIKTEVTEKINNVITKVEGDSFVKQDSDTQHITIGKDTGGDKIDITNKEGQKRTFTGLKEGNLSADSSEAVTGSQLFATNKNAKSLDDNISKYLGGGAEVLQGKEPTYKIGNTSYNNVASAFSGIDSSFTEVNNKITDVKNSVTNIKTEVTEQVSNVITKVEGDSLVKWEEEGQRIKIGAEKHGNIITIADKEGKDRKLSNVQAGDLSKDSTDAVNGSQLFVTNNDVTKNTNNIIEANTKITQNATDITKANSNIFSLDKNISEYLGGGANVLGSKKPTYNLSSIADDGTINNSASFNDVGSAFEGLDTNIKNVNTHVEKVAKDVQTQITQAVQNINTTITNVTENNLVQHDNETGNITIGAKENGTIIHVVNNKGETRTITGVRGGDLSANSNEAVTGSQLFSTNTNVTQNTTDIKKATDKVTKNYTDITLLNSNISKYLGSEVNALSNKAPTYIIQEQKYNDVASAFTGVDSSFTKINNDITDVRNDIKNSVTEIHNEIAQKVDQNALLWDDKAQAFVARHEKKKEEKSKAIATQENSKITFLLAGDISKDSTDAVTGSQLYSVSNMLATYLGGGAGYNDDGKWSAPTFKIKTFKDDGSPEEKSYDNVADALSGVSNSVTNIKQEITNQVNNEISTVKGDSLVKKDKETNLINIGKEVEGNEINIANKSGNERILTGIKKGGLSANSNEAVNGSQLYSTDQKVNTAATKIAEFFGGGAKYENGQWTAPTFTVKTLKGDGPEFEEKTYNNVGEALADVGTSITNVKKEITNQINNEITKVEGDSLVKQNSDTKHITIGAQTDGDKIDIANKVAQKRTLTGLKKGDLSEDSNEAVTGSQLFETNKHIATYLGGGAGYMNGEWKKPDFKVKIVKEDGNVSDETYNDVASAFSGVGSSFTNVNNKITNIKNDITKEISQVVSDSVVKWDETTKSITIGKEKDGTVINIQNKNKVNRAISGVGGGVISKDSNEAVNGSQLYSLNEQLATYFGGGSGYNGEGHWTAPKFTLESFKEDGNVANVTYDNVAAAFSGVGSSFTNVNNKITDVKNSVTNIHNEIAQKVDQNALSWSEEKQAFVATHGKTESKTNSKLTSLQNGDISANSTDAITGGQLFSTDQKVNTAVTEIAKSLGGGAGYKDGKWTTPTFKLKTSKDDGSSEENAYDTIAGAFEGIGTFITNVQNKFTEQVKNVVENINTQITNVTENNLIQHDTKTGNITIGLKENGTEISLLNKEGKSRTIAGVKAAVKGDEAVNKTQLDDGLKGLSDALQSEDSAVVHYDKGDKNGTVNYASVTFGGKDKTPVALHNVADGVLSSKSHDAINGGQINKINEDVAQFLGGSTSFKDGVFKGPTYNLSSVDDKGEITAKTFSDVGLAFTGLDTNIKNVNKRIKEVSQSVAQDSLSWSNSDHAFVAMHGEEKTKSKITHLSDGNIASDSADAVTGGQLYSMSDAFAKSLGGGAGYKDGKWITPTFKLKTSKDDGNSEEKIYNTVAEAFEGIDTSIKNVQNKFTEQVKNAISKVEGESLIKLDEDNQIIKIGAEKHGNIITLADKDSKDRTLSGVKNAEKSNEAVNKAQLDEGVTKLSDKIEDVRSVAVFYDTEEVSENARAFTRSARKAKQTSVTFGNPKESAVSLRNVGNGKLTTDSTEAINGSQLYSLGDKTATYFGGNATFKDGALTVPTYKISNITEKGDLEQTNYNDVGAAFAGLDTSVKNVNTHLMNEIKKFDGKIADISQEVKDDALWWSKDKQAFVAEHGEDKNNSKLTSLQNGEISKTSTDAVAGNQLYSVSNTLATYLGGNASYENGKWTAPKFTVQTVNKDGNVSDATYDDVASAFAGVGTSFTNVKNEITKQISNEISNVKEDSLIKKEADTNRITIGKEVEGSEIDIANKDGTDRTLSGVKTATENNEAVNKGQLDKGLKDLSISLQSDESAVVHYDKKDDKNGTINYTSVTFGGKDKTPVGLHNVADGAISSKSYDAINGSQLYSLGVEVAKSFGGDASYENGKWIAPSFKVKKFDSDGSTKDESYASVTAAFEGVNNSFSDLHKEIKNEITNVKSNSLVKWNEEQKLIKIGGEKEGAAITIVDKDSKDRILSGVKTAENDNDAVNKGQLDENVTKLSKDIEDVRSVAVFYDTEEISALMSSASRKVNKNSVTFGDPSKSTVSLHNVGNGKIAEDSHDAINGSQLYSLETEVAKSFGGGASYENGSWKAPSFAVKKFDTEGTETEEKYNTVAAAFAEMGNSITNIHNEVKKEISKVVEDSLVQQKKEGDPITIGKETDGTIINLQNKNNENRTISGVIGGTISKNSIEAINGSQLYALGTGIAKSFGGGASYENGTWTAPTFTFKTVNEDGSKVEDTVYHDVADAFAGVGTSFEKLQKEFTQSNTAVTENIKQNALLWSDGDKAFVAQHGDDGAKSNSKIMFLSNGNIAEGSTDAVNGSQLFETNKNIATYLGGNAQYSNGQWTAPTFTVKQFDSEGSVTDETYNDVATALAGVGSSFAIVKDSFTNIKSEIEKEITTVQGDALLWSAEENAFVALHGKGDTRSKSKLKSLLDGDIAKGSTEAITGNQLYSLNQTLALYFGGGASYEGGKWTAPDFKIAQFNVDGSSSDKKIYHDVAGAFDGVSESMTSINERIKEVSKNIDTNSLHWNDEKGSYDASHKGTASKITNVANGKIEKGSQDVVTGDQLWSTNERVTQVESKVDTIDQHVQDIATAVTDGVVNYDKDENGKKTNSITLAGGNESDPVLIDNVAEGQIEKGSKQAVTGGQLHDYTEEQMKLVLSDAKKYTDDQVSSLVNNGVNDAKSYTDMKFETLSYAVEDVRKEARQAAAIGLAVSNLSYDDTPGKLSISLGTGLWHSQSAFAFGAGYTSENGRIRTNVSATSAGGHWGVGAGLRVTLN